MYALNVALLAEQIAPGEGPGRRHPLAVILSTVLAGLLSWAKDLRGIGQWAKSPDGDVDRTVGLAGWQPDRSRIRQILARLDCELLYCVFDLWARLRAGRAVGRVVLNCSRRAGVSR